MEIYLSHKIELEKIFLDEEESHHCIKVMRHNIGDVIMVTDGRGKLFEGRIVSDVKKEVTLEVLEQKKDQPEPLPKIHIAIAPTKNIDRFEWFLEKATELGVSEITPIICTRSERDKIKPDRLQKILVGAMKQSLRLWLPKLNSIIAFKSFCNSKPESFNSGFICHCQLQNLPSLKALYASGNDVLIMVGPEGDFTLEEIELALSLGFSAVSLGKSRLRTETAGIVALQTVQLLND